MTEHTIQLPLDLRALDECICGHNRRRHEERVKECTSCGCDLFSKTVYKYSSLINDHDLHHDAE
jgi:hypothetical protein